MVPLLAALSATGMVYRATSAAFTASTTNTANSWAAGTVTITDGASGVLFNVSNLKPNDSASKCIVVSYGGSLNADVRFYIPTTYTGNLGTYLTLQVDEGTGNQSNCGDFVLGSTLTSGSSLATVAAASHNFATGLSLWAPAGAGNATRTYKVTWTLQDDNLAQNQTLTGVVFTWEARNT
jgi:hypothetical protein